MGSVTLPDIFLSELHHSPVPFRQIVGERHGGIGQKAEHVLLTSAQAQQEVVANPARLTAQALPRGGDQGGLRVVERETLRENGIVTSFDQRDELG